MNDNENYILEEDDGCWLKLNNKNDPRVIKCKAILKKKKLSDIEIEKFLTIVWSSICIEQYFKFEQKDINDSLCAVSNEKKNVQIELFKMRNKTAKNLSESVAAEFCIKFVEVWVLVAQSSRKKVKSTESNDRSFILSRGRQIMYFCDLDFKEINLIEPIAIALSIVFDTDVEPEDIRKSYDQQKAQIQKESKED